MSQKNKGKKPESLFRDAEKSFFYEKQLSFPRFPTVYQLDLPKKFKYTKTYDLFYEAYFEQFRKLDRQPIIGREEIFLHNYLKSLANRGNAFRIVSFAKFIQMDTNYLIKRLDRLEDALLIHRVQRLDLSGKPNDIIVHEIPHETFIWDDSDKSFIWNAKLLARIQERVLSEETRLSRKETGFLKVNGDGDERLVIPRSKQKFAFDYKKTFLETFEDDEAASQAFAEGILLAFCHDKDLIKQDAKKYDHYLRQRVYDSFKDSTIRPTEKHYHAALTLRRIYAPVMSEF